MELSRTRPANTGRCTGCHARHPRKADIDIFHDDEHRLAEIAENDAKPDGLFGYVMHPVDLATNKAAAAAGRREPRDIIDLVTIHERILPLGAVLAATVGRFPGPSPEELLAEISRRSWLTPSDIAALSTQMPIDPADMHRRIRAMLEDAEAYLKQLPSDAVGFVFLRDGQPVQPDPKRLKDYAKHAGSRRGSWPSSPEIGDAMLDHVTKRD